MAIGATTLAAWSLLPSAGRAQGPAQSSSTTRIHGTITEVKGDVLEVQTTGGASASIGFAPTTPITAVAAAKLDDIKPGSFVGSAARPGPDGKLVALEVHIFAESMRGAGEGHRPMDIAPQASMTNGTVGSDIASVSSVAGRTITVAYAGGEQRITVPQGVPVVSFAPGSAALLTRGAHVSITAGEAAGGALTATRITVGKDGATPPL
jgi:hypothetical protein